MTDPFAGQLTYFRVYSGTLKTGSSVFNVTKGTKDRIGRLLKMHANKREEIDEVYAGDIAAAVGLKGATTGDTLAEEKQPVLLEVMKFPEPVIAMAIEPKTKQDQEKMGFALQKLAQEDPSFRVRTDEETAPDDHCRHGRACTWKSSSIACCANLRWRRTSASRKWPSGKRSAGRPKRNQNTSSRPAVEGSMATWC